MFNYNIDRAILVHIFFFKNRNIEDLLEFQSLVSSAKIKILQTITGNSNVPNPKYFVGNGKVKEIAEIVKNYKASMILFNHFLSPAQERNLTILCKCKIIDYTGLILYIFAKRAQTYEGKLQVELAQLRYLTTRLVHGWTHLERQKGGIGLHGPGETQLEIDRRLIKHKISQITCQLKKVEQQRKQGRRCRLRANMPTISLVGYTNTGKSTLFNFMTGAHVYIADQMFSTLDPTIRRIRIGNIRHAVLADTVGFIRHLPLNLIIAFKATMQETQQAALLIHVVNAADSCLKENMNSVDQILSKLNVNHIPKIIVMNKIDLIKGLVPHIDRNENNIPTKVWLSAKNGNGIELLIQAINEIMLSKMIRRELHLPPQYSELRSRFYQLKAIEKEWIKKDGSFRLIVRLPISDWHRLCKKEMTLMKCII